MANPRALVFNLHQHWELVEWLVQFSRQQPAFEPRELFDLQARVVPQKTAEEREAQLRALVNADILQALPRGESLQVNPLVLEFVRGLTREHELGLSAVLQARVQAIREASARLLEGLQGVDMDLLRRAAGQLGELFRQIAQQLDQDRHAILELAERAKAADSQMPAERRYREVLQTYDDYVEPMAAMMDSGADGTFYRHLEEAEQALDLCVERLSVQGSLYTQRQAMRQVAFQAKELRRLGREVLIQCSDTLLPLREELRQHNSLSSAISLLLGRVRKRGLNHALRGAEVPLWRAERPRRVQIGDQLREIMAQARDYQPVRQAFPDEAPALGDAELERLDLNELQARLHASLPVPSLLDWLHEHYGQCADATLLRLYHQLIADPRWRCEQADEQGSTDLKHLRVHHYAHGLRQHD
jgi:hypothetical protein